MSARETSPAALSAAGRGSAPLLAVAAGAGAGTMAIELAAVRLLAPWFGTSVRVWTNVIGVILLALAIGYLLGARWASGRAPERRLAWTLLGAAGWSAWLPALAGPACRAFLPEGLGLHQSYDLWTWGSLAATLVLFLPPALLLGCVGPLCVEAVQRRDESRAGSAGGRVLGWSTLGSLVGTFATTHGLVPWLGLSWTFLACAGLLAALALFEVWRTGSRAAGLIVLVLALPAFAASRVDRDSVPEGVTVLEERESPYQSLRVVEDRRWGEPLRILQVNEGLDSFQSVWRAQPGLLGPGYYYDLFALPAWWSRASGRRPDSDWKALVLGLGAGTTFRVLAGASPPGCELDLAGVEVDATVIELGRKWFELPAESERVRAIAGQDGRAALRRLERDFDLIVLDAYAHQVEIPFHLATVEALREMGEHLAPGGWLAINVGGFGFDDPVVSAVGATAAEAFGSALAYLVPRSRNVVVFARKDARVPQPSDAEFRFEGPVAAALLPALSLPSSRREFRSGEGLVLRDDESPIEQLQMRSLEEGRERLAAAR